VHFRFEPSGELAGGLRLIDEIPDYPICHLEGRNGAGKSLALRLLELISGQQPYSATPSAWSSLRENLRETTITIAGLDGKTLRVDLKPERWKSDPDPVGDWLGDALFDGKPIAITAIGSCLRVVRIGGDETLQRTIKLRLAAESSAIERAHTRFEQQRSQLEGLLASLADETAVVEPMRRDQERLDRIAVEIAEAELDLRSRQIRIDLLNEALLARQRLAALVDQLPSIQERLGQIAGETAAFDQQLQSLRARQAALLAELAGGSEAEEEIERVRRTCDKRRKRYQGLASRAQRAAARLRVPVDEQGVGAATMMAKTERDQVQAALSSAGHNASVRGFMSRVARDLDVHRELDGEVIALVNTETEGLRLTARDLRAGLQRRQVELAEIADDPLLRELRERARELSIRVTGLAELTESIRIHRRAGELLRESEDELAALVSHAQAAGEVRVAYEEVTAQLATIEDELRQRLAEEVRLRVQSDELSAGKSRGELIEQVTIALERLQLTDESALDRAYQVECVSTEEQRARLRQLRIEQLDLQRSLAHQATEVAQSVGRLAALSWLPVSVRQALSRGSDRREVEVLLALRHTVAAVRESLYVVRDRFDKLVAAARTLKDDVGRGDRTSGDVPLLAEFSEEIGKRLRDEFNQEEIRIALFDGGQLTSISLANLEAHWITKDGERRTRPFEAFSSGEQVFAYTRARIERVASVEALHKVIALDEFGAFLARDRLERLARYLRDAIVGKIAEQVIIVVPLAANYGLQAQETTGELHARFVRRAAEIAQHLYFTEDATTRELV
jgi:hypothetical protein